MIGTTWCLHVLASQLDWARPQPPKKWCGGWRWKQQQLLPEKNLIFVVCSLCAQALESEFIPTSILNVKIQRMQGDQASPSCPVLPCPVWILMPIITKKAPFYGYSNWKSRWLHVKRTITTKPKNPPFVIWMLCRWQVNVAPSRRELWRRLGHDLGSANK